MKYGGDEKKRGAFLLGNGHSDQNLGSRDDGHGGLFHLLILVEIVNKTCSIK